MKEVIHNMKPLTDEKFKEVLNFIAGKKEISTTKLQIEFKWGYHRAGHTMDRLESLKIITAFDGANHRKVLKNEADIHAIIDAI